MDDEVAVRREIRTRVVPNHDGMGNDGYVLSVCRNNQCWEEPGTSPNCSDFGVVAISASDPDFIAHGWED